MNACTRARASASLMRLQLGCSQLLIATKVLRSGKHTHTHISIHHEHGHGSRIILAITRSPCRSPCMANCECEHHSSPRVCMCVHNKTGARTFAPPSPSTHLYPVSDLRCGVVYVHGFCFRVPQGGVLAYLTKHNHCVC